MNFVNLRNFHHKFFQIPLHLYFQWFCTEILFDIYIQIHPSSHKWRVVKEGDGMFIKVYRLVKYRFWPVYLHLVRSIWLSRTHSAEYISCPLFLYSANSRKLTGIRYLNPPPIFQVLTICLSPFKSLLKEPKFFYKLD